MIDDLEKEAIQKARQLYKEKNSNKPFYDEIDSWTDTTFLDRLNVTIEGKITNMKPAGRNWFCQLRLDPAAYAATKQ